MIGLTTILLREVEYMQHFISDTHIRAQLTSHINTLKVTASCQSDPFVFYTDGSLIPDGPRQGTMGIGWISEDLSISFHCSLHQWPSSTRAELGAIWTALLTAPLSSHILIKTDSQAAIDGIRECLTSPSQHKWHKTSNPTLKNLIVDCIHSKDLHVRFIKVKGHSGDEKNDMADSLAKLGTQDLFFIDFSLDILQNTHFSLGNYFFRPLYKFISIENNVRHTVRSINRSLTESHWASSSPVRAAFCSTMDLVGQYMWAANAHLRQQRCLSFNHHNHWVFTTKLVNDLLPTTERINRYSPGTFSNWKCPLCDSEEDTIEHLCSCPNTQTEWNEIFSKLEKLINKFISTHDLQFSAFHLIRSLFTNDPSLPTLTEYCRHTWLKGIVHASTVAHITKRTKKHTLAHTLIIKIIRKVQQLFRSLIWLKRCKAQKNKERCHNIDVSEMVKARRRATRIKIKLKANKQKQGRRSSHHSLDLPFSDTRIEDDECVCLDDIPLSPKVANFRPDRKGLARDWYEEGMNNWLVKGIRANWMLIKDGGIGKIGKNLVSKYISRASTAESPELN